MTTLGNNIKYLRKENKYNQTEFAGLLGVSQTSIAHYEAGTRQPTIETLISMSELFSISIDQLVGNHPGKKDKSDFMDDSGLIDKLVEHLVSKDEDSFMKVFNNDVCDKYEMKLVLDHILKEVMYKIGDLWEIGKINEADEHYATNIVRKAINYLSVMEETPLKNQKAVTLIVGSETHTLGLEMVNMYLETEGVETIYIGSNIPIRSLIELIIEHKPDYLFISITINEYMNSLMNLVRVLDDQFGSTVKIAVGGQGLIKDNRFELLENVSVMNNLNDVKAFIE